MHAICRRNSYSHGIHSRGLGRKVSQLPQRLTRTLAVYQSAERDAHQPHLHTMRHSVPKLYGFKGNACSHSPARDAGRTRKKGLMERPPQCPTGSAVARSWSTDRRCIPHDRRESPPASREQPSSASCWTVAASGTRGLFPAGTVRSDRGRGGRRRNSGRARRFSGRTRTPQPFAPSSVVSGRREGERPGHLLLPMGNVARCNELQRKDEHRHGV